MQTLVILVFAAFFFWLFFMQKAGNNAVSALEHGDFKATSFVQLDLDIGIAFDADRNKVGFIRFDVPYFNASGASIGLQKQTFSCALDELFRVEISTHEKDRFGIRFLFNSEVPAGNILKSVSFFGSIDKEMLGRLKKHIPQLPYGFEGNKQTSHE